ncbi:hypothetical protein PC118_g17905 [Phytophthora cactorum]|uniref:Uncharacterized protein n=1 Tax=Phytophthora cactorum TaxID=29920 RepID=A0A8T1FCL1_9STRA|nr:hypothetical protein PC118_g17905 [Phytophthora cactorum]
MMRIRSSSRMKQTAVVRDLWRQLKAAGWELKKPTRLSRNWGYFEPRTDESELVDGPIFFTARTTVAPLTELTPGCSLSLKVAPNHSEMYTPVGSEEKTLAKIDVMKQADSQV